MRFSQALCVAVTTMTITMQTTASEIDKWY
eukprot:COSAG06_NODE_61793_length_266_cov_1.838323_1_plen_29_part_10